MKCLTIAFAGAALIAGLLAAFYWYKSAIGKPPSMGLIRNYTESPETGLTPIETWLEEVAGKNRRAAGWSAVAVALGAVSSILGAL